MFNKKHETRLWQCSDRGMWPGYGNIKVGRSIWPGYGNVNVEVGRSKWPDYGNL